MGSEISPSDSRALLTRPTVALKNQANWKPIRTGANIIGIISSTRAGPTAYVMRARIIARPKPMKSDTFTVTVMKMTVLTTAFQKTSSRASRA